TVVNANAPARTRRGQAPGRQRTIASATRGTANGANRAKSRYWTVPWSAPVRSLTIPAAPWTANAAYSSHRSHIPVDAGLPPRSQAQPCATQIATDETRSTKFITLRPRNEEGLTQPAASAA